MWYRTALLCLIVIGYLERVRTASDCSSNDLNSRMCEVIDKEINPCDDFYQFACGKYIEESRKKFNYGYASMRDDAQLKNKGNLLDILKSHLNNSNSGKMTLENNLVIDLYKSCMNKEKLGLQPMLRLIESYGGWPVLTSRVWKSWVGLEKTKGILNEGFDMAPILKMKYVSASQVTLENSTEQFLLELPNFAIDRNRLLSGSEIYHDLMIDVAIQFGANAEVAWFDMRLALLFELGLIKIYDQPNNSTSITINEMQLRYPALMKFIRPFIEPFATINSGIKINLEPLQYFEGLELRLKKTTDRTIANYLIWRAVVAASEYLTTDLFQRVTAGFNMILGRGNSTGYSMPHVDNEECSDQVQKLLPMALDNMYINEDIELLEKKKIVAYRISENIREEFIEIIQESWMDDETKEKAINKLNSILLLIADADFKLELENLSKLKLDSENFLQNFLSIGQHRKDYPINGSRMSEWAVNAAYYRYRNEIYIPAGILQWPLFLFNTSSYFNYGALGWIIGHEIGHAFSSLQLRVKSSNWLKSTKQQYIHKVNCLKRQYSEMDTETGIKLNSSKTIKEDICDNLGIKAAYQAYRKFATEEEPLIGLWNYTHRQLFWISMAQPHCDFVDPRHYRMFINEGLHTLSKYRVLGMVVNMAEFSEDFHCRPNTIMYIQNNRNNRCELL